MSARVYKIGTRRSLLALTQSNLVKEQLEALHPGIRIELVGMDTEGDETNQNRFSDMPLHLVDGKNFFVKELDEALLSGKTDISVHSYKDLSLERPEGITVAAVPARANPRDVLLLHPCALEKIRAREPVIIGSSSPRRAENTAPFLATALQSEIRMVPIRGNVNTRIKKLQNHVDGMDGIILAFAGLSRIYHHAEIKELMQNLKRIVLPLDQCPAAPAQGALAIECRADDQELLALLKSSHSAATASSVARERAILKQYGGGCHQAFGATSILLEGKPLTFIRGKSDDGKPLDLIEYPQPKYAGDIVAWNGSEHRAGKTKTIPLKGITLPEAAPVLVAHYRAVTGEILPQLAGRRIWVSGIKSWKKLAEKGLLVQGSAENLGFDSVREMLADPMLGLPDFQHWVVLTHEDGAASWKGGTIMATYRVEEPDAAPDALAGATHIWWASGSQFLRLNQHAIKAKFHACPPGKSAAVIRANGIEPDIFPSQKLWLKCVKQ